MKTIGLILIMIIINTIGQVMMKKGVNQIGAINLNISTIIPTCQKVATTPFVVLGFLLYGISAMFWIYILSKVDLSYAYPMLSLGYIIVVVASWVTLHEHVSWIRLSGVILTCTGVYIVART